MERRLLALATVLSFGLVNPGHGYEMYDGAPDQAYDKLGGELGTPHIKWAKPYSGGRIKALVICPTWGHWETLELAQRLDLDYTPIMAANAASLEKGRGSYNQVQGDVVLKLARTRLAASYDLIIIGKMKWSAFPEDIQAAIVRKVRNGAGLVYVAGSAADAMPGAVYESNASNVFRGVPWQLLPAKNTFIQLGSAGKGRVALINCENWDIPPVQYRGSTGPISPFMTRNDPLLYECYFSAFLRTILWAFHKEPAARVRVTIGSAAVGRESLPAAPVEVSLAGERPASVECIVSDESSLERLRIVPVRVSPENRRITIPKLRTGKYLLSVIARDAEGRSIGWGSAPFKVTSSVTVGEVKIDSEDTVFARGDTVSGSFVLEGEMAPGQKIVIELVDNYGRLLARETPPSGKTDFALLLNRTLTSVNDVRVQCRDKDGIIDERTVTITCPEFNRKWDDFAFSIWVNGRDSRHSRLVRAAVRRHGFDVLFSPSPVWDPGAAPGVAVTVARENFKVALYAAHMASGPHAGEHHSVKGPDGPMVNKCFWTDDRAFARRILAGLRRNVVPYLPYGVAAFSLGDENMLGGGSDDFCFCPPCQTDFREFIKRWYGDLAKVNREWGSAYKSWEEVKPISLMDAYKRNRYPQWIDHRYHMEDVFYRAHKRCVDLIRNYDADALIGNNSFTHVDAFAGPDIPRLMRLYGAGAMGTYNTPLIAEQIRSFAHKDLRRYMWWGAYNGQRRPEYKTYELWHHVILGMKGNMWYRWTGDNLGGESATTINPTVPLPYAAAAAEEIREVKSGIGKLFVTARNVDDPIAIHHSSASKFASIIRPNESTWELSNEDFIYLVKDSGFGFKYIDTEDIESGQLMKDRYRVLILPYSQAISAKEVKRIKEFVGNGGLLVADFSPAIMDEHGKRLEKSGLSDVFGAFEKLKPRKHGRGHTIYLGDFYAGYTGLHKAGKGAGKRDSFRMMLKALAGLRPEIELHGLDLPSLEIGVFRNGTTSLYGVLAEPASGEVKTLNVHLRLPTRSSVYDVRKITFFGTTDTVALSVTPGKAVILATVPAEIRSLDLATDKAKYRPGQTVRLNAAINVETGTVIRITVANADGALRPHYCANVHAPSGKIAYQIPLALNESSGRYTITATDVISGLTRQKEISVEE